MLGHIIRQLEERHVSTKIDLMVWSNKMDLLALSNTKGEIALHRLTWQRVWLLPPPTPNYIVRHITWRPDGRVLAVAYVSNITQGGDELKAEVMLIDVENKDILHATSVSDDVSCLVWLQETVPDCQSVATHNQDGTSDFLPKLPSLSRTFGSLLDNSEENFEDAKKIKDQTELNFLLIGTCDGNLYLSVFGLFSCGVTNINKYMTDGDKGKYTSVLNAEMSSDMKSLFLLVAVDKEKFYAETTQEDNGTTKVEESADAPKEDTTETINTKLLHSTATENVENENKQETSNGNKSGKPEVKVRHRELKIVVLDTRVLSSRSRELHALSLKHGSIISLLDYLEQTMRSIIEAWENIYLLEIESKLSKHAESLPEGSLSADFLELLMTGVPSDSLENFLMKELNDKSIKKLGHSIELSHSNIQKLILKHLLSVGQSLAYHLAEMKGMAKLTDRFKVLGLEEEAIAKAFTSAGAFLIKSTEVQLVIDENMKRYKAFFRWLYAIILRITDDRIPDLTMTDISQQDLEYIADYLYNLDVITDEDGVRKRHCYLDRLGQYLVNRDLTTPSENEQNNHWQKLLEKNPCLQNHFSIIQRCKSTSLLQQHDRLKEAIDNVFKTPVHAIGNMFQVKKIANITYVPCLRLSMCLVNEMILIGLIEAKMPDTLSLIHIPVDGSDSDIRCKYVSFRNEEKGVMKCLDVHFYLPEILSVLIEEQDENRNAVIAQVMTKPIYENSSDIIDGNTLSDFIATRHIQDMVASIFAVSGTRKVAIVLSESRRKVRLFEMEAEEDEEEEEEMIQLVHPPNFTNTHEAYEKALAEGVTKNEDSVILIDSTKSSPEVTSLARMSPDEQDQEG